jgi:hypothetical protein
LFIVTLAASNEFFLQFPNCLAYESIEQCVLKLQYALENEPEPLSDKYRHTLSWDGATDRLFEASGITKREAAQREELGMDRKDLKAARLHVETAEKTHFVSKLFLGKRSPKPKKSQQK